MKDGHALVLNSIEQHGEYKGTEVVLWMDGGAVSVVSPVKAVQG
jgi:hypothetical protein